jgi:hypothetical protein
MEGVPVKLHKVVSGFLDNLKEVFDESLVSAILFRAYAHCETSKKVPISFLVVVKDNSPSELARCTKYLKRWNRQSIAIPLFVDQRYIEQSLDTFPLEFMDMASSYSVVYGRDVLKELSFKQSDVRNQCERELKGKLIHLRAEYLNSREHKKKIIDLVSRTLTTFRIVFSGTLYLKGYAIPKETEDIINTMVEAYELDAVLFTKLINVAKGKAKMSTVEADRLFDMYVENLDKLSHIINNMVTSEGT